MEDYITDIKPGRTKKSIIYVNDLPAFSLYDSEINKLKLKVDERLTDETFTGIVTDILIPRALNRCLLLLKSKEYTSKELKDKLKDGYYPETVISAVMDELIRNRFVNDARYAEQYIAFHSMSKSRTVIEHSLLLKGIDKDTIDSSYESFLEYAPDPEKQLCLKHLESKYPKNAFMQNDGFSLSDKEEYMLKNKAKAFLARKGFSFALINEVIAEYFDTNSV